MLVSRKMMTLIEAQEGWTRKMFEAAIQMKKDYGAENVYDFSLGNPDVEPPPEVQEKLLEAVAHPVPGMHRYMPNPGYEDVREQIADYLKGRTGLTVYVASRVYDRRLRRRFEHRFEEHAKSW